MSRVLKNIVFWTVIVVGVLFFYKLRQPPSQAPDLMDSVRFNDFLRDGKIGRVLLPRDATLGGELTERDAGGKPAPFLIATPAYRDLVDDLLRHKITVEFYSPRESSYMVTILSWLPMLVLVGVWIYFMRTLKIAQGKQEAR